MEKPRLIFKKDYPHYQTFDANAWTMPVRLDVQANGWVRVCYQDDAVVHYPREAFDMIIEAK